MKKKTNSVHPCQVATVTGGIVHLRRKRRKKNRQFNILLKEVYSDIDGLKNRMCNPLLPLVYSSGSQYSLPVPLRINKRRYCLVEYMDNIGNKFRFIYRIEIDRNGYQCAIVFDQTGFVLSIPPHFIERYCSRAIQTKVNIDFLVQTTIMHFVCPLSQGINVGEYIVQQFGIVPIQTRKGLLFFEEKYEVIILLTFLPPSYIKDSLVKELGLPDDYNKSNMN